MLTAVLCGGVTITPDRGLGAWAAYNASYGLASIVPTPAALQSILPACVETLRDNPYALAPRELRVTLGLGRIFALYHRLSISYKI
jgi:hypothetical protein